MGANSDSIAREVFSNQGIVTSYRLLVKF